MQYFITYRYLYSYI